jgi:hypothetical protein
MQVMTPRITVSVVNMDAAYQIAFSVHAETQLIQADVLALPEDRQTATIRRRR